MISPVEVTFGCDPEVFVSKGGAIIGSEKVIPAVLEVGSGSRVVQDGIQIEFNPEYRMSITELGQEVARCFNVLGTVLKEKEVDLCMDGLVEVSREELDSLSESTRILGCQPSKNIYGDFPITVDASIYRKRSAGGHIHFGLGGQLFHQKEAIITLMDIFVGNTCVMLDRDPGAKERRENYGRAGEYREQPHGVEYRTLSNFWLRNYALMAFVFGMSHFVVSLVSTMMEDPKINADLDKVVNIQNFRKAIDTNDLDLAAENWKTLTPFLQRHLHWKFPLTQTHLTYMVPFGKAIQDMGIAHFFPTNPLTHWSNSPTNVSTLTTIMSTGRY